MTGMTAFFKWNPCRYTVYSQNNNKKEKNVFSKNNSKKYKEEFESLKKTYSDDPVITRTITMPEELGHIKCLQRKIRSNNRKKFHMDFFKQPAQASWPSLNIPAAYSNSALKQRLNRIICELTSQHAVINGDKSNHVTTIHNLKSIIKSGYMMGHAILERSDIFFQPNVYMPVGDRSDAEVICFSPAKVDPGAFFESNFIKPDRCNLILKIQDNYRKNYNQFFKLTDLNTVRTNFKFKINDDLHFHYQKLSGNASFSVDIHLKNKSCEIRCMEPNSNMVLFYGNVTAINKFCLTRLTNILFMEKENDQFGYDFLNYLDTLSDAEIKKIFIVFSQFITLYSEFNINGYLDLNECRIEEIRLYNQMIKFDLRNLTQDQYLTFLSKFKDENPEKLYEEFGCKLSAAEADVVTVHARENYISSDLSAVPADIFNKGAYVETRPGVNNIEDSCYSQAFAKI